MDLKEINLFEEKVLKQVDFFLFQYEGAEIFEDQEDLEIEMWYVWV